MDTAPSRALHYRRCNFVTDLPVDYLYSPSHFWIAQFEPEHWRVGLTKFATRMLGEMVDHAFQVQPGAEVAPGQTLGWVEGFKAISDLFCIAQGRFTGSNPALKEKIALISEDPYRAGWLYTVQGRPASQCVDVYGYRDVLDQTIDRLQEQTGKKSKDDC